MTIDEIAELAVAGKVRGIGEDGSGDVRVELLNGKTVSLDSFDPKIHLGVEIVQPEAEEEIQAMAFTDLYDEEEISHVE